MGTEILIIIGVVLIIVFIGAIAWVFLSGPGASSGNAGLRGLMPSGAVFDDDDFDRESATIEEIKRQTGSASSKKQKEDLQRKFFRAGYFSQDDKQRFRVFQIVFGVIAFILGIACGAYYLGGLTWTMIGAAFGGFFGVVYPLTRLDKAIAAREEDIMYFLPLVIEQVSIGVSSSLDIGPCVSHIVTMAEERDSHNPVTEMFVHVEKLIRSGLNLEDSLAEVAEANGMTEVKHAFMFLAQCARHGGEVSKQLQELADSVMTQRQVQVEERITALPVKATGPLSMVFAGFFGMLFAGLLVRLLSAFTDMNS
jgi:Flp pilus assembly protein TadB